MINIQQEYDGLTILVVLHKHTMVCGGLFEIMLGHKEIKLLVPLSWRYQTLISSGDYHSLMF